MNRADPAPVTARSQLGEWRRLLVTLLLVLSPSLLAAAGLEALSWQVGETVPPGWVSRWQDGAPDRIWRGGDGHSYLPYKLARIAALKPEVIALGASRANGFRGDAVAPATFYNAGQTAWTWAQYRRFLELITRDGYAPRVLVFNLDYWMFSPGFDHYWGNRFDEHAGSNIAGVLRVLAQLRDDPVGLWRRLPTTGQAQGLYAVLSGAGFRGDGALTAPPPTSDPQRLADDGTEPGAPPVVLSDAFAPEQIRQFDEFAALAKAKHIALIGIQMPFYGKILQGLSGDQQPGIWRDFKSERWRERIAATGVVFFDFADMPEYRDKPEYFIDSLDPDARLAHEVMRRVIADPRVRPLFAGAGGAEVR